MAKIVVTGGAGFIGSHVVDRLIEAGHSVAVIDNLSSGRRENLDAKARLIEMDMASPSLAETLAEESPDAVIHLAAQIDVRQSLMDPAFDANTNIVGSLNLLEACVKAKVRKFVYASTGGAVYGEPAILPASEETPILPLCHYGVSKYTVEQYTRLYKVLYGMDYTVLRFPNVYGPRQSHTGEAGVCAILIGLMLAGKRPTLYGHGAPLRDYVYAGDIARGCVLALTKGDGETVNLGSGKGTSVRELFDVLAELLGYSGEPDLQPLRAGEIDKSYITGERAARVLGWRPEVALREGLRRTAEHVRGAMG